MRLVLLTLVVYGVALSAQQGPGAPAFEVASIKPMESSAIVRNPVDIQPGGRLIFRNTVKG